MKPENPAPKSGLKPTMKINVTGKDAKPVLVFLLGLLMIPVFSALSTGPAYLFSEHAEDAKIAFYFPKGQPVWVSPWLYHFSTVMQYLMFVGMAVAVCGVFWLYWRRKHVA